MKILHFSDVHLEDGFERFPRVGFLNKRLLGLANLRLRRGKYFKDAHHKVNSLILFAKENQIDLAISTGDYTALGTEPEMAYAYAQVAPFETMPYGHIVVPGNHDLYVSRTLREQSFKRHFGKLIKTEMPEYSVKDGFPFVRFIGGHLVVIGVNSVRPNDAFHLSSGRILDKEIHCLSEILEDNRLDNKFVLIATHYAARLSNGQPDAKQHGLDNANAFLDVCKRLKWGAVINGHVHHCYHVEDQSSAVHLFCAGSATHAGREGAWVYDVQEHLTTATPIIWSGSKYELVNDRKVNLLSK